MARRNVTNYLMDIHRATGGQFPIGRVQQALADAVKLIDQRGNWAFLGATALINTEAPYSVGTVAAAVGGTSVTGTSTSWDPTWVQRDVKFADRQLAYRVASISGVGTLALESPLSGSAAISGGSYVLYRARYFLPVDCEPGRDIMLRGAIGVGRRGRIPKYSRPRHESRAADWRGSGNTLWYTDDIVDTATNRPTILLYPYPSTAYELRLFYYRKLTIPSALDDYLEIPETFELLPIKLASAALKKPMVQGWMQDQQEADNMLRDLYNRHAASAAYEEMTDEDENYGEDSGVYAQDGFLYTGGY